MQNNVVAEVLDYEMVHWNENDLFIAHKANKITYVKNGIKKVLIVRQILSDGKNYSCLSERQEELSESIKL